MNLLRKVVNWNNYIMNSFELNVLPWRHFPKHCFGPCFPTKDTRQKVSNFCRKCHYSHPHLMWHLNLRWTFAVYQPFNDLVHRSEITCFVIFCEQLRNGYKYSNVFMGHQKPFWVHWSSHMHMVGNLCCKQCLTVLN